MTKALTAAIVVGIVVLALAALFGVYYFIWWLLVLMGAPKWIALAVTLGVAAMTLRFNVLK